MRGISYDEEHGRLTIYHNYMKVKLLAFTIGTKKSWT